MTPGLSLQSDPGMLGDAPAAALPAPTRTAGELTGFPSLTAAPGTELAPTPTPAPVQQVQPADPFTSHQALRDAYRTNAQAHETGSAALDHPWLI